MTIGRTDEPGTPLISTALNAASLFGAGSRIPSGPAVGKPRQQAGHMTALVPVVGFFASEPLASEGPSTHEICPLGEWGRGADTDLDRSRSAPLPHSPKMNGSKGNALGGVPRGSAPWWGF